MTILVEGTKYSYQEGSDKPFYLTTKKLKPETLFKYYSLNNNSVDSLTNSYIYASHPNQLNDVFDVHHNIIIFADDRLNDETIIPKKTVAKNAREALYRRWGIFSLAEKNDDILMWSYYTNHKGFCIEFDYSKFEFTKHGPFPINYVRNLEPILIEKPISINDIELIPLAMFIQSNIKYEGWKHENEWRFLIQSDCEMISPPFNNCGHNRKFIYPIEAIKSITLGIRFFEFDKQIDKLIFDCKKKKELEVEIVNDNKKETDRFKYQKIVLDFIVENKIAVNFIKDEIINNNIFGINNVPNCKIETISPNQYKFTTP